VRTGIRWSAALLVCSALLAGCGDDGSNDDDAGSTTPSTVPITQPEPPPSGPVVRICDKRLVAEASAALRAAGFRGRLMGAPVPNGTPRLSVCELDSDRAELSVALDAASDAPRRYRNRVTETAQFSGGDPDRAPHTVRGVGDDQLGAAGANWLPRTDLLLSVRGNRVLIVDVSAEGLGDGRLRSAAIEISLGVWDRLAALRG
jgi:hypothetical protein